MHRATSLSLLPVLVAIVITIMLSDGVEVPEAHRASNRVIVIGAGFAGLAAAKHLRDNGKEVLVLEARDRIGGRVVTDRSADGVPLDMGASWIHGVTKNPIFALAKSLGVPLSAKTNYDSMEMFDVDGTRNAVSPADLDRFVDAVEVASRVKVQQKSGDSLEKAIMDLWKAGKLSFFNNLRELNFAIASEFDLEYAGDASLMSAQQPWEGEEFGGGDVVFPAGYDQLPTALAEGLDISLETIVTNIAHSSSGVTVTTNKGTHRGSRVIVTVPVGVLRSGSITFSPALPLAKRQALGRIGMGTLNKVWMIFPNTFWDTRKTVLAYASEPKGHFAEFYYFKEVAGGKALLALNGGLVAESLESKPDQEIIDEMLATLRIMYGADRVPAPTHTRISRWSKDPYSHGSYSFLQAGASFADRVTLRSAVAKRVFFAGEALHVSYPATVHGAYLSGIQAAKDVLKL